MCAYLSLRPNKLCGKERVAMQQFDYSDCFRDDNYSFMHWYSTTRLIVSCPCSGDDVTEIIAILTLLACASSILE